MIGESDKVLEEDPYKKPSEFIYDFFQFAAKEGYERIIEGVNMAVAGTVDWYQVPKNKTLYITNTFISVITGANAGDFGIRISSKGVRSINVLTLPANYYESQAITHNFPIKLESESYVKAYATQNCTRCVIHFIGFLVDSRVF